MLKRKTKQLSLHFFRSYILFSMILEVIDIFWEFYLNQKKKKNQISTLGRYLARGLWPYGPAACIVGGASWPSGPVWPAWPSSHSG
jgi:hypothetical protein